MTKLDPVLIDGKTYDRANSRLLKHSAYKALQEATESRKRLMTAGPNGKTADVGKWQKFTSEYVDKVPTAVDYTLLVLRDHEKDPAHLGSTDPALVPWEHTIAMKDEDGNVQIKFLDSAEHETIELFNALSESKKSSRAQCVRIRRSAKEGQPNGFRAVGDHVCPRYPVSQFPCHDAWRAAWETTDMGTVFGSMRGHETNSVDALVPAASTSTEEESDLEEGGESDEEMDEQPASKKRAPLGSALAPPPPKKRRLTRFQSAAVAFEKAGGEKTVATMRKYTTQKMLGLPADLDAGELYQKAREVRKAKIDRAAEIIAGLDEGAPTGELKSALLAAGRIEGIQWALMNVMGSEN